MTDWFMAALAILALLLFWLIGAYNRLVRLRVALGRAFAALDPLLTERLTWIESLQAPVGAPDVASADAGVAAVWTRLAAARDQFALALASLRRAPADGAAAQRLVLAEAVLQPVWAELLGGPEEGAAPADAAELRAALDRLRHQERPLADAFNAAVQAYNHAIGQFPALLLARAVGFGAAAPLTPAP